MADATWRNVCRHGRSAVAAAFVLLAACGPEPAPLPAAGRHDPPLPHLEQELWLQKRTPPCRWIADRVREVAGAAARPCSEERTNQDAIACANDAFRRKQPFTLCAARATMDSFAENGVAGLANGSIQIFRFDTLGPQYRGTCVRPNVSLSDSGWPQCRRALVDEIDLRTGRPPVPRRMLPGEEPWPDACAARALHAPPHLPVKLVSGSNPIPDPGKWALSCTRATAQFELLIDRQGKVVCARVISAGHGPPPPGLYDSIRTHLSRWRFEPPALHGSPLEVRVEMATSARRKGDAELPGPRIHPVCP